MNTAKSLFRKSRGLILAGCMALAALSAVMVAQPDSPNSFGSQFSFVSEAQAATTNFPSSVQVVAFPIHLPGAYTTTITPMKFTLPYAARLQSFSTHVRSLSGTMTIDLQANGVSLLSSPVTASSTVTEGTVATAAVADEAAITVVLTISGSSPTFSDVTVIPTFTR